MHIHLNGADLGAIARWREAGLIDGVTTNPAIAAAGAAATGGHPVELLREIVRIMGPDGQVFAQVLSRDAAEQLEEARFLAGLGPRMVIKVLMDTVGQRSIPLMVAAGVQVAATAVNSVGRAIAAARCGAHYVIPYYGWLEDAMEAPTGLADDIAAIYRTQGYRTHLHVLVRRVADLRAAGLAGAWGVLLDAPDIERIFFHHAQTDVAVNRQHAAWRERFGETTWLQHRGHGG
jgi:TalC/MipB family fructose-6-phosphate aldolase